MSVEVRYTDFIMKGFTAHAQLHLGLQNSRSKCGLKNCKRLVIQWWTKNSRFCLIIPAEFTGTSIATVLSDKLAHAAYLG